MKNFKILNSKKIKLLILMSLVLTLTLGVYIYTGKNIALEVDGEEIETVAYSNTIEELIEKEEINFQEGAYISLPLDTKIEDDMAIVIINPKTYMVKDQDNLRQVSSIHNGVDEILADSGMELGSKDYTEPSMQSKLEENDAIEIFRVREEEEVKESKIKFEKVRKETDELYEGKVKLKQKGKNGMKETHIMKRYVNDKLIKEEVTKKETIKEKKDHIVLIGTKKKPAPKPKVEAQPTQTASRSSSKSKVIPSKQASPSVKSSPKKQSTPTKKTSPSKQSKPSSPSKPSGGNTSSSSQGASRTMQATGYSTAQANLSRYTANGTDLLKNPRVIAVDPSVIPLGTVVEIAGYGRYVAADTGGAIKGTRIDIHFSSVQEALSFGRRSVQLTIIK